MIKKLALTGLSALLLVGSAAYADDSLPSNISDDPTNGPTNTLAVALPAAAAGAFVLFNGKGNTPPNPNPQNDPNICAKDPKAPGCHVVCNLDPSKCLPPPIHPLQPPVDPVQCQPEITATFGDNGAFQQYINAFHTQFVGLKQPGKENDKRFGFETAANILVLVPIETGISAITIAGQCNNDSRNALSWGNQLLGVSVGLVSSTPPDA